MINNNSVLFLTKVIKYELQNYIRVFSIKLFTTPLIVSHGLIYFASICIMF